MTNCYHQKNKKKGKTHFVELKVNGLICALTQSTIVSYIFLIICSLFIFCLLRSLFLAAGNSITGLLNIIGTKSFRKYLLCKNCCNKSKEETGRNYFLLRSNLL